MTCEDMSNNQLLRILLIWTSVALPLLHTNYVWKIWNMDYSQYSNHLAEFLSMNFLSTTKLIKNHSVEPDREPSGFLSNLSVKCLLYFVSPLLLPLLQPDFVLNNVWVDGRGRTVGVQFHYLTLIGDWRSQLFFPHFFPLESSTHG